jgi:DNA-binding NarL/FixJ family response regulator
MAAGTALARVVLAEDDVLLREGLASLLERSGYEVVGQCGTAPELLAAVREYKPDLAIVDIRMPPKHATGGLDAARVIREQLPQTAILVLSACVEIEHAMDLLASGERSGYLLKSRGRRFPRDSRTHREGWLRGRSGPGAGTRRGAPHQGSARCAEPA